MSVARAGRKLKNGCKSFKSDAERVAFLFDLYQRYTSLLPAVAGRVVRRARVKPAP